VSDGHLNNIPASERTTDAAPAQVSTYARPHTAGRQTQRRPAPHVATSTLPSRVRSAARGTRPTDTDHPLLQVPPPRTHVVAPTPIPHPRRTCAPRMQARPEHTRPHAPSRSPETGFSAYVSRAPATPAIRQQPVHMAWDWEAYQLTPWRQDVWAPNAVVNDFSYLTIYNQSTYRRPHWDLGLGKPGDFKKKPKSDSFCYELCRGLQCPGTGSCLLLCAPASYVLALSMFLDTSSSIYWSLEIEGQTQHKKVCTILLYLNRSEIIPSLRKICSEELIFFFGLYQTLL